MGKRNIFCKRDTQDGAHHDIRKEYRIYSSITRTLNFLIENWYR